MRKSLVVILLSLLTLSSCVKNADQGLMCEVTLTAQMPDGTQIVAMSVDMSVKGNYFRNYNTKREYAIPTFVNGSCRLRVLKGLYVIGFDAVAECSDSSDRKVRCTSMSSPDDAAQLTDDAMTVELELMEIK